MKLCSIMAVGSLIAGWGPVSAFGQCAGGFYNGRSIHAVGTTPQGCESEAVRRLLYDSRTGFFNEFESALAVGNPIAASPLVRHHQISVLSKSSIAQWHAQNYVFTTTQFPGESFVLQVLEPLRIEIEPVVMGRSGPSYRCSFRTRSCHWRTDFQGTAAHSMERTRGSEVIRIFNGRGQLLPTHLSQDDFNPDCTVGFAYACD